MGDTGDDFAFMRELNKERKERNLANASREGWHLHTEYHWSRTLARKRLDYWPSKNKFQYDGQIMTGDVLAFIAKREPVQQEGTTMLDKQFLLWLFDRLEQVYKVNTNTDFMHKLKAIIHSTDENKCSTPAITSSTITEQLPYILTTNVSLERAYNPLYGDTRLCKCSHSYDRHFDSYENMEACGCKYCSCDTFVEDVK